jgi:maleate isomerase
MSREPDTLGWRLKIGLVIPSTNTTAQPEIDSLRLPGITLHTGRIPIQQKIIAGDKAYLEHVKAMRDGIKKASDEVLTSGPDHLIMGVALEAFWDGAQGAADLEQRLSMDSKIPVTIGSTAVRDAAQAFGAKRLAILTPHMPKGDQEIVVYFEQSGFEVKRIKGLCCESPRAIAQVSTDTIEKNLIALDGPDVDAILQLGTNLAGSAVAARLETKLGKPVIAINPACYWHALRVNGIKDQIKDHGSLLETH